MQALSMASFAAAGRHRLLKASLTPVVLVLLLCLVDAAMPTSSVAGASRSAAGLIAATAALGSNSRQKRPLGREGGIQPLGLPVCADRGSL
jgi:hypothetical protein